jgi:aspartate racemase
MTAHKTRMIGLIGGLSWQSSVLYYRLLNEGVHAALGRHHNARSVLHTLDFEPLAEMGARGDWAGVGDTMAAAARSLAAAGADCVLITANTGHLVADRVAAAVKLPLLHIADAAGAAMAAAGMKRIGLLGTKHIVEADLYPKRLGAKFSIDVTVPRPDERDVIHRIIFEELSFGRTTEAAKRACLGTIERMTQAGADGIVLACTELPLLLSQRDTPAKLFDTTQLHVDAAIRFALGA